MWLRHTAQAEIIANTAGQPGIVLSVHVLNRLILRITLRHRSCEVNCNTEKWHKQSRITQLASGRGGFQSRTGWLQASTLMPPKFWAVSARDARRMGSNLSWPWVGLSHKYSFDRQVSIWKPLKRNGTNTSWNTRWRMCSRNIIWSNSDKAEGLHRDTADTESQDNTQGKPLPGKLLRP